MAKRSERIDLLKLASPAGDKIPSMLNELEGQVENG